MIIDCIRELPTYHQLFITHNHHRTSYQTMTEYLSEPYVMDFISYEEAQKCLLSDSIWEVQLYPISPISFYKTIASTLEECIKLMLLNYVNGKW